MSFRAITGVIELRTALHVGTGNGTETADDLVRRDARGRLLLPGTAIAGALRSIATRLAPRLPGGDLCHSMREKDPKQACGCLVCKLFGDINPQEDDTAGNAARVIVYDAVLDSAEVQIRDGVGIDRVTGAARKQIKFDLEVLPEKTEFKLRIEIDPKLQDECALQLLAATLAEWEAGRGAVGGRVSRGLGACVLKNVQLIERDLGQADALMDVLRNGPPWDAKDGKTGWIIEQIRPGPEILAWRGDATDRVARSWALAEFTLAAAGPFLTHDLVQAGRSGFDHAPVLSAYRKPQKNAEGKFESRPILPGSSLRGVLRSQAERIARTLATLNAWGEVDKPMATRQADFRAACPACNPLTTRSTDEVASCNSFIKTLPKKEREQLEQEGAEDKLCLACRLFGSTWNGSRLRVEDAPFAGKKVEFKVLDFLAIDRFTGGGRDSAKFDAAVLWKPKFSVRLFLDNPLPWELGWLALTLRDLQDGLTTVGFGAAKGFGQCSIEDPKLTVGVLHDDDFPLPNSRKAADVAIQAARDAGQRLLAQKRPFSELYQTVAYASTARTDWLALANGWVKMFNEVIDDHKHAFGSKISDSYFGQSVADLYPARVP